LSISYHLWLKIDPNLLSKLGLLIWIGCLLEIWSTRIFQNSIASTQINMIKTSTEHFLLSLILPFLKLLVFYVIDFLLLAELFEIASGITIKFNVSHFCWHWWNLRDLGSFSHCFVLRILSLAEFKSVLTFFENLFVGHCSLRIKFLHFIFIKQLIEFLIAEILKWVSLKWIPYFLYRKLFLLSFTVRMQHFNTCLFWKFSYLQFRWKSSPDLPKHIRVSQSILLLIALYFFKFKFCFIKIIELISKWNHFPNSWMSRHSFIVDQEWLLIWFLEVLIKLSISVKLSIRCVFDYHWVFLWSAMHWA